jgi:hypothetical protein
MNKNALKKLVCTIFLLEKKHLAHSRAQVIWLVQYYYYYPIFEKKIKKLKINK